MYRDEDVTILKPDVKKGILIFTGYKQPSGMPPLCEAGLKTGAQLQRDGVDFGRSKIHPYIFFRAPYYARPIDYTSVDTEIASSFDASASSFSSRVWIRVDPERTNVYSSEIRAKSPYEQAEVDIVNSRKTMSQYLEIINENAKIPPEPGKKIVYNLYSSRAQRFIDASFNDDFVKYPLNTYPINTNSEVLVRVPHLTPDFFVKCT